MITSILEVLAQTHAHHNKRVVLQCDSLGKDFDSLDGIVVRLGFQSKSVFLISFEPYKKSVYKYYNLVSKMSKLSLNKPK